MNDALMVVKDLLVMIGSSLEDKIWEWIWND